MIYVLDGDALFGIFAEAASSLAAVGEIESAVVVGVSGRRERWATIVRSTSRRMICGSEKEALVKQFGPNRESGGVEPFGMAHVNPQLTFLFGWSLGALFVTYSSRTTPLMRHTLR